jgi:hypothetical protein
MPKSFLNGPHSSEFWTESQAATVQIGDVTTAGPGGELTLTNTGTAVNQVLDIQIPRGLGGAPTVRLGNVTTTPNAQGNIVTNVGTSDDLVLDFAIPRTIMQDADRVLVVGSDGAFASSNISVAQLAPLAGATSNIQLQLDTAQEQSSGGAVANVLSALAHPNRLVTVDPSGNIAANFMPAIETAGLWYLQGLRGNIQEQIQTKQPAITSGPLLTVLAGTLPANSVVVSDSTGLLATVPGADVLWYTDGLQGNVVEQLLTKQLRIHGAVRNVTDAQLDPDKLLVSAADGTLAVSNVSVEKSGFLTGIDTNVAEALASKQPLITGAASSLASDFLTPDTVCITTAEGKLGSSNVSAQVLPQISDLRGDLEMQLAAKQNVITQGPLTTILNDPLVPTKVVVSTSNGTFGSSNVDSTALRSLVGLTNALQEELTAKQTSVDPATSAGISVLVDTLVPSKFLISNANGYVATSNIDIRYLELVQGLTTSNVEQRLMDLQPRITGGANSVTQSLLPPNRILVSTEDGTIGTTGQTLDVLDHVQDLTSDLEQQLVSKQPVIAGAASSVVSNQLEPGSVVISGASGKLEASNIAASKLWYLDGLGENLAQALNSKLTSNLSPSLASIAYDDLQADRVCVSNAVAQITTSELVSASNLWYLDGLRSDTVDQIDALYAQPLAGAVANITYQSLPGGRTLVSDSSGNLAASSLTSQKLWYLDGLRDNVESQLQSKQALVTGAATSVLATDFQDGTSNVVVYDAQGKLADSKLPHSTFAHVAGLRSSAQAQLDAKHPLLAASSDITVGNVTLTQFATGATSLDTLEFFGDGGDGNLYAGFGSMNLSRDMYFENVTLGSSDFMNPNGCRIFVSGTLNLANANPGCLSASAGTVNSYNLNRPAAPRSVTVGGGGYGGSPYAADPDGQGHSLSNGGNGGNAGVRYDGAAWGKGGIISSRMSIDRPILELVNPALRVFINGGAGGGGSLTTDIGTPVDTQRGMPGAPGAGVFLMCCRKLVLGSLNHAYIRVRGSNGGNLIGSPQDGAGGGGGGGGGYVFVVYGSMTGIGRIDAGGGDGGVTFSRGHPTGPTGGDGGGGGTIQLCKLSTGQMLTVVGATGSAAPPPTGVFGSAALGGAGGSCIASFF